MLYMESYKTEALTKEDIIKIPGSNFAEYSGKWYFIDVLRKEQKIIQDKAG